MGTAGEPHLAVLRPAQVVVYAVEAAEHHSMNLRLGPIILVAVALLGCRDKSALRTPPTPASGGEIALFQIGMPEEAVQNAIPAVPNFRSPDGEGFAVTSYGDGRSGLAATPFRIESFRPESMRFAFEAQRLVQVELTYRAPDAAARSALYDRLLGDLAGSCSQSTNRVLDWGGRIAWLHGTGRMLLLFESRTDARAVSVRMTKPVFE